VIRDVARYGVGNAGGLVAYRMGDENRAADFSFRQHRVENALGQVTLCGRKRIFRQRTLKNRDRLGANELCRFRWRINRRQQRACTEAVPDEMEPGLLKSTG